MVFSNQAKAVRVSSYRLLKRFHEDNSMEIRARPGRQRTITTKENLIRSQEDNHSSHMLPREAEKTLVYAALP